jgi:hypothetical protein
MKLLLFGISPLDLLTYLMVPLVLGGTAVPASYMPARRAAGVDPGEALRVEYDKAGLPMDTRSGTAPGLNFPVLSLTS